jgi:hypothetical protein
MHYRRLIQTIVVVAALSATLAACTNAPTTTPGGPTTTAASGDATAQITANWQDFFNAKTDNSRRAQLLENGTAFAATIQAQAANPLAATATAQVTKVTLTSPTQATVTYSILVGGQPALPDQTGTAILDNGTWKVSAASFCNLLFLENGNSMKGLPAPCAVIATPSASAS